MTVPTFKLFAASARSAVAKVTDHDVSVLGNFDRLGPSFHFKDDGGIDSLDMLDVYFYIDKDLGIQLEGEKFMRSGDPMTLDNLYKYIHQDASTPA